MVKVSKWHSMNNKSRTFKSNRNRFSSHRNRVNPTQNHILRGFSAQNFHKRDTNSISDNSVIISKVNDQYQYPQNYLQSEQSSMNPKRKKIQFDHISNQNNQFSPTYSTNSSKNSKATREEYQSIQEEELVFFNGDVVKQKSTSLSENRKRKFYDYNTTSSLPTSFESQRLIMHPIKTITSFYVEDISRQLWQYYMTNKQTEAIYKNKVQLKNSLLMIASNVFENAGLFITGSSINGFGSLKCDMDLSLTITSQDLHQKKEAFAVLQELLGPLRQCNFIEEIHLIRATVPILKFRDKFDKIECDLNINNVDGIYNTHLLAMYNRVDWRLAPLGIYIKNWAKEMDLHDASKGRLSTYAIMLMVIQYLQAGCHPPVLPSLQARFPQQFSYRKQSGLVDLRQELPWHEVRSKNSSSLYELLMGFFEYYVERFDFSRMAVSVRCGRPIPIQVAIDQLQAQTQTSNMRPVKVFIEEPFSSVNVARSLYDETTFPLIKRCFRHSMQVLRMKQSLHLLFVLPDSDCTTTTDNQQPSTSTKKWSPPPSFNHNYQSLLPNKSNEKFKNGEIYIELEDDDDE